MNVFHHREPLGYDGSQLRSHWIYETFGVAGDAIVYFAGPCRVLQDDLVDLVDRRQGDVIVAAEMLHFICEHFDPDMTRAVLRQHLLAAIAGETISREAARAVRRDGDDLFVGDRKLSVSIATVSPVSCLIHFGINIDPEGAPVAAIGLRELGVDPDRIAEAIAHRYADEMRQVATACTTARWVK